MSFRWVKFYALFLAGLLPAGCLMAQTNSPEREQSIIFSSPDGEVVSNALLPAVEAPRPSGFADMPSEVPETIAYPQMGLQRFARPALMPVQRNKQSLLDEDETSLATPSQIMGVPTLRDIFGLPKPYATFDQKKDKNDPSAPQDSTTNSISSEDADWTKILSGNTGESAFATDKSDKDKSDKSKSPRDLTGFFDSTPTDDSGKSLQDKYQEQDDSVFGSSPFGQTPAEQTSFNAPAPSSETTTPVPASTFSQSTPTFDSAFGSGLNSQSPFAVPNNSVTTLPQPPSLPVAAFQNNTPAAAAPPSWAPKPPPWLSQTPSFGNMGQR
jgi:hypothetical protein